MVQFQLSLPGKMVLKTKGRRKKRKDHHLGEKRCKYMYECIDGNWTYYPIAYCDHYKGVLTRGLMHTTDAMKENVQDFRKGMILNDKITKESLSS